MDKLNYAKRTLRNIFMIYYQHKLFIIINIY